MNHGMKLLATFFFYYLSKGILSKFKKQIPPRSNQKTPNNFKLGDILQNDQRVLFESVKPTGGEEQPTDCHRSEETERNKHYKWCGLPD